MNDEPQDSTLPADAGMSLMELIIAGAITALLTGLMATMLITGLNSDAASRDRDLATGRAQVVSDSIATSVRNANAVRVDGAMLRARVAVSASTWECRGWALASDGRLLYRAQAGALPATPTSDWTAIAEGVRGTLTGSVPFSASSTTVTLGYTVTLGDASVPITSRAVASARPLGAGAACW